MNILLLNGHGGNPYDTGATGNGYKEAVLTRELADLVQERLKAYCTVHRYSKDRDAFADCVSGVFKSHLPVSAANIKYALEIHFNAYKPDENKDGRKKGAECYVTTSEKGITVEQEIMKNLKKFFPLRDNDSIFDGVKRTNFLVIKTLKNMGVSGALLETCFIDDADDIDTYQKNKKAIADAIVNGIVSEYKLAKSNKPIAETKPKPKPKPTTRKLHLPKSATKWRVYHTNIAPVVGNECGYLNPSLFGGLTYDILATPQKDVVTIKTRDFGKVNIFVGHGTGATIK